MEPTSTTGPDVCSYEGSSYRTEFWEGQGREYEDLTERVALKRMMPPTGKRLLEIGAGFGRLTNEFDGFEQVILLDYSRSLLQEAQQHLGQSDRYIYVAADLYRSPIADASCDAATMIRVIHHMQDAPAALQQVRNALTPGATFVLEFANKRNFKAILSYWLRQRKENPFTPEPYEFVELNFNFHPKYIQQILRQLELTTTQRLALSYLRMGFLKRTIPVKWLVALDAVLQRSGALFNYSPSVFTKNIARGTFQDADTSAHFFKCPACGQHNLTETSNTVDCGGCGARWAFEDGIYDFKTPITD